MDVCCAIEEAKCCSAEFAYQYAIGAETGTPNEETLYKVLTLNAFIRTLCRYDQQEKNFHKKNKSLSLNSRNGSGICLRLEDLKKIIEQIKLLCSNCNCNCT